MRVEKYLQALRVKLQLENDKELCKTMGWSAGTISNWKKGSNFMTNKQAGIVSEIIEVPVIELIAAIEADREEVTGQQSFWTAFFQRTVASVALVAGCVNLFLTPTPSQAAPMLEKHVDSSLYYVKLLIWQVRLSTMLARLKRMFSGATLQPATS
jgi:transcriptional regulator with XRE-family HTH domain